MTRVPVKGQSADIADRLKELINSYISSPSCIILAVSAANTDLANSDAIMLSQSVDPDGHRTIGLHPRLPLCLASRQRSLLCCAGVLTQVEQQCTIVYAGLLERHETLQIL